MPPSYAANTSRQPSSPRARARQGGIEQQSTSPISACKTILTQIRKKNRVSAGAPGDLLGSVAHSSNLSSLNRVEMEDAAEAPIEPPPESTEDAATDQPEPASRSIDHANENPEPGPEQPEPAEHPEQDAESPMPVFNTGAGGHNTDLRGSPSELDVPLSCNFSFGGAFFAQSTNNPKVDSAQSVIIRGTAGDEVDAVVEPRHSTQTALTEGDRVAVNGYGCPGSVKFVGHHHEKGPRALRIGVELDEPLGKHGKLKGRQYFSCKKGHGVIVAPSKVNVLADDPAIAADQLKAAAAVIKKEDDGADGDDGTTEKPAGPPGVSCCDREELLRINIPLQNGANGLRARTCAKYAAPHFESFACSNCSCVCIFADTGIHHSITFGPILEARAWVCY